MINLERTRTLLQNFDFKTLFIEELGWSQPVARQSISMTCKDQEFSRRQVAQLAGVVVFEIKSQDGNIPDAKTRAALQKEIAGMHHENLLIFVDERRTQSLWCWIKRQNGKSFFRDHIYVRGQPGDLFLGKLNSMVFDISEFDETGNVSLVEVTNRLKQALDVERVTKKFYTEFQDQHLAFLELIEGIVDERDKRWYASVLLNRLMFIYFLQRKFFLDNGDGRYLQNKLTEMKQQGRDLYYSNFLKLLFFEGFAKPEDKRDPEANKLLGRIKYLNGGLFLLHPVEERWPEIAVPDKAFENLYALFERYSWNLNDTPGGEDNEINPDVLGYIFEKYINQKAFGAYYTRPEITEYLCERTIHRLIMDGVNTPGIPGVLPPREFESIGDLLINLDVSICRILLHDVLPNLRLLDPVCGSAAFLVAAMKTLINIYAAVIGKIEFLSDRNLRQWLDEAVREKWELKLAQELNMTSDSKIFHGEPKPGRIPLVQGGMIHQYNSAYSEPKFWIDEKEGRKAILGRVEDEGQKLPYEVYRFAHRRIARSTDERAAIACILPPRRFCADIAQTTRNIIPYPSLLFLTSVFNSFVVDWELRLRITTHVDMHFVYAIRIPRLAHSDPAFAPIVTRTARLICTTPEFDDLAKEVGLKSHKDGATDPLEREKLRAELDGMIAHLYGLTEGEFAYILTTFPLVTQSTKDAALAAYRDVGKGLIN